MPAAAAEGRRTVDDSDLDLETAELDAPVASPLPAQWLHSGRPAGRRTRRQQRTARAVGVAGLVLLALALVLSLVPGGWSALRGLALGPFSPASTPTPSTAAAPLAGTGADRFVFEHTVPSGTLT